MTLPLTLQESYVRLADYPVNLIHGETAIHTNALRSYRRRLDDSEVDLCLNEREDSVDEIFEVTVIDLATADGKGKTTCHIHHIA